MKRIVRATLISPSFPKAATIRARAVQLADDDGWRMAFAWGETLHAKGDFEVNAEFAADMIETFEFMRDEYGYFPPIGADHAIEIDFPEVPGDAAVVDGITYGLIVDIETREDGIWVRPKYNRLGTRLNELGAFLYVSPSFYPEYTDPHSGRVLKNMLREFTQCGRPHQKNLATPIAEHYGLSEDGFAPLNFTTEGQPMKKDQKKNETELAEDETSNEEEDLQTDEKDEMIAQLQARIAELEAALASANEGDEGEEELADGEEEADASELSEMRSELSKMRKQLALSDAIVEVQNALPGAPLATVRDGAEIKLNLSDGAYSRWLALAKNDVGETADGETEETRELGETGTGSTGSKKPADDKRKPIAELVAEAKENGIGRGGRVISYCTARGYDLREVDSPEFHTAVANAYGAH